MLHTLSAIVFETQLIWKHCSKQSLIDSFVCRFFVHRIKLRRIHLPLSRDLDEPANFCTLFVLAFPAFPGCTTTTIKYLPSTRKKRCSEWKRGWMQVDVYGASPAAPPWKVEWAWKLLFFWIKLGVVWAGSGVGRKEPGRYFRTNWKGLLSFPVARRCEAVEAHKESKLVAMVNMESTHTRCIARHITVQCDVLLLLGCA